MTDMAKLKKRKEALDLAIVYVDPDAFIAHYMRWLEITAFITAQRAGLVRMPDDGITPLLSEDQLKRDDVQNVGNDAIFAFCMTAADSNLPLAEAEFDGTVLTCSSHSWTWDLNTGEPIHPKESALAEYPVKVEDGGVYIDTEGVSPLFASP